METALEWLRVVLPTVLALVLGWVSGALTKHRTHRNEEIRRIEEKQDANNRATLCLVRKTIIDGYDTFVRCGAPMTVERRHEFTELYKAYKGLNGNGVVDHLYEELADQPTVILGKGGVPYGYDTETRSDD